MSTNTVRSTSETPPSRLRMDKVLVRGITRAVLSSGTGRHSRTDILCVHSPLIWTSTASSATTPLATTSGPRSLARTSSMVGSTSRLSICSCPMESKVSDALCLDPWRWASLQESKGNVVSRVANCTNCAHCVDLYTPSSSDSSELKKIRDEQYLTILGWLEAHWRKSSKKSTWNPLKFLISEE